MPCSERVDQHQKPAAELRAGISEISWLDAQVDAEVARLARPEAVRVAVARDRGDDRVADRGQGRPLCVAQHAAVFLS